MERLLIFGYDEMVRKIGAWPVKCISSLSTILDSFQCLETIDGKNILKDRSKESWMIL